MPLGAAPLGGQTHHSHMIPAGEPNPSGAPHRALPIAGDATRRPETPSLPVPMVFHQSVFLKGWQLII